MKSTNIISILLALALFITVFKFVEIKTKMSDSSQVIISKKDAVLSVIHSRKSVRKYTDQKVSKDDLITIMKAAMAAPSGHDTRPWKFVSITNPNTITELRKELVWASGLDSANAAIVVCGDMSKVDDRNPEFWITDTSAATQNMLLAIEAMGLGGVWCTIYPGEDRMAYARKVLNLPEDIMPLCVIPIGYPSGGEKSKNKFDSNNIHWDKW
ncbi:MAG: nitroreductase family protein [Marinifilaceae bacterium]